MIDFVIAHAHDTSIAGHVGVEETCFNLRMLWFPSFRCRVEHHLVEVAPYSLVLSREFDVVDWSTRI